jgi:acyl carrier protein
MSIPSNIGEARETRGRDTGLQFIVGQDENYAAFEGGSALGRGAVFDANASGAYGARKMIDLIREIIDAKGHLPVAARTIDPNANLYEAGLSPFAAIQVMLALENACGVEFPKQMQRRRSFSSLNSIAACLEHVERKAA